MRQGRAIIATCSHLPPTMPPVYKSTTRPPTSEEQLRRLLYNRAPHETIRSEVWLVLNSGNIINAIKALAVGEQARLLEIIDQVCTQYHSINPSPLAG